MAEPGRPRILCVDDTPLNLDVLVGILRPCYDLRVAPSAEVALKIAARQRLDLALVDVMMPTMDGFELVARLRGQDGPNSALPAIMVSAIEESDMQARLAGADVQGVVSKPVVPDTLLRTVETVLGRATSRHS